MRTKKLQTASLSNIDYPQNWDAAQKLTEALLAELGEQQDGIYPGIIARIKRHPELFIHTADRYLDLRRIPIAAETLLGAILTAGYYGALTRESRLTVKEKAAGRGTYVLEDAILSAMVDNVDINIKQWRRYFDQETLTAAFDRFTVQPTPNNGVLVECHFQSPVNPLVQSSWELPTTEPYRIFKEARIALVRTQLQEKLKRYKTSRTK